MEESKTAGSGQYPKLAMNEERYITVKTVSAGDVPIYLRSAGTGPFILLIHGWLHSGARWADAMESLSKTYTLLAPDLPGFGKSPPVDKRFISIDQYGSIMASLVDAVRDGGELRAIVGDSLGGLIALTLIETRKVRVKQVMISGCPAEGLPAAMRFVAIPKLVSSVLRILHRMPISLAISLVRRFSFFTVMSPKNVDLVLINDVLRAEPGTAEHILRQMARSRIANFNTLGNDVAATVVRGSNDRIVSRRVSKLLAYRLAASYQEIPESGHTPALENKISYLGALQNLLRSGGGSESAD